MGIILAFTYVANRQTNVYKKKVDLLYFILL